MVVWSSFQVWPKSCGHVRNKEVVSREEALQRIAAAVEARDETTGIAILARTDARQAESFEEALFRIQSFADAGADILFIDALESEEEMERFCSLFPSVPKLANMLEGGGKTPILSPKQLENIGFKLAAYPLSLLGVSMNAMQQALDGLQNGQVPDLNFRHIQDTMGFNEYFDERDRFSLKAKEILEKSSLRSVSPEAAFSEGTTADTPQKRNGSSEPTQLEADDVIPPQTDEESSKSSVLVAAEPTVNDQEEKEDWFPSFARIRVKNTVTDKITMEFKLPVGFLDDVSKFVPALKDMNLRSFVTRERFPDGQPALQFTDDNDLVEVFLE